MVIKRKAYRPLQQALGTSVMGEYPLSPGWGYPSGPLPTAGPATGLWTGPVTGLRVPLSEITWNPRPERTPAPS